MVTGRARLLMPPETLSRVPSWKVHVPCLLSEKGWIRVEAALRRHYTSIGLTRGVSMLRKAP